MYIGRILLPIHSLGPGDRICVWTQGCSKNCKGCISPELQEKNKGYVDDEKLIQLLLKLSKKENCKALTISGGDPFEQISSLLKILKGIRESFEDILVYTGYYLEEIKNGVVGNDGIECLEYIDVLIDGRYIEELNKNELTLRGSCNQTIYILNNKVKKSYEEYISKGRTIETFIHNDEIILTGILNKE